MSTQPQLSPIEQLTQGSQPTGSPAQPQEDLSPIEKLMQKQSQGATQTPDDAASNTRQMLVSGLTGMPTPNMTDADKASFARGKAAGAISVPAVAGATLGATAAPEIIPGVVQKARDVVEWAKTNPIKSVVLAKMADELGVHPFDLMHAAVKYGKNLFGGSEEGK